MKRKRGAKRKVSKTGAKNPVSEKSPAVAVDKNSGSGYFYDSSEESDSELESDTSSSSSEYVESTDNEDDHSYESTGYVEEAKLRRKSLLKKANNVKVNKKVKDLVNGRCKATYSSSSMECDSSSHDEDIDSCEVDRIVKEVVNAAMSRTKNSSKKVNKKVRDLINRQGKGKSKGLDSSSRKPKKSKIRHQERQCDKKALEVALAVIKKVMKMDEAEPFNAPVDPMALGMQDYFDVIDTPMDFGTICSNLQSGLKYMKAEDVFKDVQIIWDNCYAYNKKGACILILMKRVKKKFMKYWTTAGLSCKQARKTEGNPHVMPPTGPMTHNRCEPRRQAYSGPGQIQLDNSGPSQLHFQFPSSCNSEPYQSHQPYASTMQSKFCQLHADCGSKEHQNMSSCPTGPMIDNSNQSLPLQPRLSYNQSYYLQLPQHITSQVHQSQSPAGAQIGGAGYSNLRPHTDFTMKRCNGEPRCPLVSMDGSPSRSQTQKPQMNYNQPCSQQQTQQIPNQPQVDADISTAEHSPLLPRTNHTTSHDECLPKCPVDPTVVDPQLQPHHPTARCGQKNKKQEHKTRFGQDQQSQPQASIDTDCAESPMSDNGHTQRHFPMMDSPSIEIQARSGPSQPQPQSQQTSQNLNQPYESQQLSQKKEKGKLGSAWCKFLRDMNSDEQITVPLNRLGQPIGPESAKLRKFLGMVAKDGHMAPLTYVNWRKLPKTAKEDMWQYVQSKFKIEQRGKPWILQYLSIKWRNWKAELKLNHYYPHQTDEERLQDLDFRVLPDQWPVLVSFWNSEKAKVRSAANKAIRARYKSRHNRTGGKKSGKKNNTRFHEEETKSPNMEEPTREELDINTHNHEDRRPANEEAAAEISGLQEQGQQQKNSERSDECAGILFKDLGEEKLGCADTSGLDSSPLNFRARTPGHGNCERMDSEVKMSANNDDASKMLEKVEAMEKKYAHMESLMVRVTSRIEKFLDKNHVSNGPPKTSGIGQVPNTSNTPPQPQPQFHSSSSSHPVPSHEVVYIAD